MDLHDPNNKCGRTQHLSWTRQWSTGNYRSVETLRVKIKINNNYDIHKTQLYILNKIILNLNTIKNIGGDKILVPTKHWRGILALTKYSGRQNLLPTTKYWRRQNIGVNKILVSTKYWRWQNTCVDKMLADAEGSPYCLARQSPQLLTSPRPRWRSPTSPWWYWSFCMQSPSVAFLLAALLLWADSLPYCTGLFYRARCHSFYLFLH